MSDAIILIRNDDAAYWFINYDGQHFIFYFKKYIFSQSKLLQLTKLIKTLYLYTLNEVKVNAFKQPNISDFHNAVIKP